METERLDCTWCGSARSIEHGICQVCLMEYPLDTQVIKLPLGRIIAKQGRVLDLQDEREVAEKA
jgi:hypothetical protein